MLVRVTRTARFTQYLILDIPDEDNDTRYPLSGAPYRAVVYIEAATSIGIALDWSAPEIVSHSGNITARSAEPDAPEPDPSETELLAEAPPSYAPTDDLEPL